MEHFWAVRPVVVGRILVSYLAPLCLYALVFGEGGFLLAGISMILSLPLIVIASVIGWVSATQIATQPKYWVVVALMLSIGYGALVAGPGGGGVAALVAFPAAIIFAAWDWRNPIWSAAGFDEPSDDS